MRPDLGRRLAPSAEATLASHAGRYDVVFVVTDGLSARAVQSHARPALAGVLPDAAGRRLAHRPDGRRPPRTGRDRRRHRRVTGADCVAVLIGERPGLTAPDSMGAYLTWQPQPHTTDADRNCISNIRPDGIGYADAAYKLAHLLRAMHLRRISGVQLKDDSDRLPVGATITGVPMDSGSKP